MEKRNTVILLFLIAMIMMCNLNYAQTSGGAGNSNPWTFPSNVEYADSAYTDIQEYITLIGNNAGKDHAITNIIALGFNSGRNNIAAADYLVAIGNSAAYNNGVNASGVCNHVVAIGDAAAYDNGGQALVAIGDSAAYNNAGCWNTAIGYKSLYDAPAEYTNNVAVGALSGYLMEGSQNTMMGYSAGASQTGSFNVAVGGNSNENATNEKSVSVGYYAGRNGSGEWSSLVGHNSGSGNSGDYLVAVGYASGQSNEGDYNTAIGTNAMTYCDSSMNTAIGYGTSMGSYSTPFTYINTTALGYEATPTKDNQVVIGDTLVTEIKTSGVYVGSGISSNGDITQIDSSSVTHGGYTQKSYYATIDITVASIITLSVSVPSGAKILGCQLHVKTALVGGEVWDAEYNDGSTVASIGSSIAVAQDTDLDLHYDENAASAITDATTNIKITKNAGGDFSAQGTIEGIVYANVFVPWTNE